MLYKWCFVPLCKSTTVSTPSKVFVSMPKENMRKKWFEIARRDDALSISLNISMFCCENYFYLQEDIENYMRVWFDPDTSVRLRKGVLPTIFDGQLDRQRYHLKRERPGILKCQKIENLNEILQTKSVDKACGHIIDKSVTKEPDVNIDNSSSIEDKSIESNLNNLQNTRTSAFKQNLLQVRKVMHSKYVQKLLS
ncbi:PREDICTED: uncharacterized protein LOC105153241 [Acromyrmex echinatior]|uniref:uncharacterized protein LOC105153241 n=1 Tax=Acromyrmex echinatior TaxID=103372 RepID=UPI000580DE67|nr:PREDICTED: uncharacterized protein LOC105153241 [Acromyrmex echinatior]